MRVVGKKVTELTKDDIDRIVSSKIQESKTLEYKRELKVNSDGDKKEFLADVSAMINSEGGVIIFGIEESKDRNGNNEGVPEKLALIEIDNKDKFIQQIEDIIQSGLEPRFNGLEINAIQMEVDKYVLVMGIIKTYNLPHMVSYKSTNKFYKRRNSGKYLLDVYELQSSFNQAKTQQEKMESFRIDRINSALNSKYLPISESSAAFFIHLIPINNERYSLDLLDQHKINQVAKFLRPMRVSSFDFRHNFEGYQCFSPLDDNYSYSQLFRNGTIEACTLRMHYKNEFDEFDVYGDVVEDVTLRYLKDCIELYKVYEIEPPIMIMLSLQNPPQGATLRNHNTFFSGFLDRRTLLFPPTVIYDFESSLEQEVKTTFDILWQSGGATRSPYYDESGNSIRQS